jgi:hypothetical protein
MYAHAVKEAAHAVAVHTYIICMHMLLIHTYIICMHMLLKRQPMLSPVDTCS